MNKKKIFGVVLSFIICFFPLLPARSEGLLAPTIENAQFNQAANVWIINGVTADNTDVMLFLDNKFIGVAATKSNGNKNVFYFSSEKVLTIGEHYFTALARDQKSFLISPYSKKFAVVAKSNREGEAITVGMPTILNKPIIVAPQVNAVLGQDRPLVIGLANAGETVEIYFDNQYSGEITKLAELVGATNFVYQPKNGLTIGAHTLFIKAKNFAGDISGQSESVNFFIEQKVPAPILNDPLIKDDTGRLVLTGLVKNNLVINLFLDEKKVDSFLPKNSNSGTNNFAYTLSQGLTKDGHLVYATATDGRGKESNRSNYIYYVARESASPIIPAEVVPEKKDKNENKIETPIVLGDDSAEQVKDQNLNKILKPETQVEKNNSGMIDESKDQQSKIKWNLLIFLLFLVALIAWMFWVNRELIKEKKAQIAKEEKPENNIQDKLI